MKKYIYAVGRRKTANVQVRLYDGKGESQINNMPITQYIRRSDLFDVIYAPFKAVGKKGEFHVVITAKGSGISAQAQAMRHAISQALVKFDVEYRKILKELGFLRRDPRKVERKKPGLHKARKASQWSKR